MTGKNKQKTDKLSISATAIDKNDRQEGRQQRVKKQPRSNKRSAGSSNKDENIPNNNTNANNNNTVKTAVSFCF